MKLAKRLFARFWPRQKKRAEVVPITVSPKATTSFGGIGNQTGNVKGSLGYLPGIES